MRSLRCLLPNDRKHRFQNGLVRRLDILLAPHMFVMWIGGNMFVVGYIVPANLKLVLVCQPVITVARLFRPIVQLRAGWSRGAGRG
jgi:hypothetical protein